MPVRNAWLALAAAAVLTGLLAGLAGMLLGLLLHLIQHVAYGYGLGPMGGQESFLEGASTASPERRLLALAVCGVIAGFGWWGLFRFGRPLVPVNKALSGEAGLMPAPETALHALLQIVTVALGSPLGREAAPREMGALIAGGLSRRLRLPSGDARIMIACGAGAGLAAVYNVPFAAAIFVIETLLFTLDHKIAILALSTCAIAAYVARIGLGNEPVYSVANLEVSSSLVAWAAVTGPVFGFAGYWFSRLAEAARRRALCNWRSVVGCLAIFPLIGVLAIPVPELLGNGKGIAQLEFDGGMNLGIAALLLVLRTLIIAGCLRAGAAGGLLTPSVASGALLAAVISGLWNLAWPGVATGGFAVVGATAFLAASLSMPISAIALMFEFTHAPADFLVPLLLAVAGSSAIRKGCDRWIAGAQ